MSTIYIDKKIKKESELNTSTVKVDNDLIEKLTPELPDSLQEHYLDVSFTTAVGVSDAAAKDVRGVHIINSGDVVVCERTELSELSQSDILVLIDEMVEGLGNNSYVIDINIENQGENRLIKMATYGFHEVEAFINAFHELLEQEDDNVRYVTEDMISSNLKVNTDINIKGDSGNVYTVASIIKSDAFSGSYEIERITN